MNPKKLLKFTAGLLVGCGCVGPASAVDVIFLDMDTGTPGIQSVRTAAPGDMFTIALMMSVDAAGVSSYGISATFDTGELTLNGAPAAANVPFGGLAPLAAPVENNALGQVYSFNGATFGAGPALGVFTLGTINFKAVAPVTDLLEDVSLGFFNGGVDGFFDNAGNPVVPVFSGGYIDAVPEPSAAALLLCGMGAFWMLRRSRRG